MCPPGASVSELEQTRNGVYVDRTVHDFVAYIVQTSCDVLLELQVFKLEPSNQGRGTRGMAEVMKDATG